MPLTPFNFTWRWSEKPKDDENREPAEKILCRTFECYEPVEEEGDVCSSCLEYFAEIKADCAKDYINRPMSPKQAREAVEAYSEPSESNKRDRMLSIFCEGGLVE